MLPLKKGIFDKGNLFIGDETDFDVVLPFLGCLSLASIDPILLADGQNIVHQPIHR